MPLQVLQRFDWHVTPIQLGDLFRLTKNRREARAVLFTHQLGLELRLLPGIAAGGRADAGLSGSRGGSADGGEAEGQGDYGGMERCKLTA
jgi:hypothetical protein